jgi:type IV secretion/conjugal transfer VirB4 family ATPase
MLSVARVLKSWKENGALHAHIPWDRWIDESVLLTKGGDVLTFLRVPGIDFECISRGELDSYTKRFEDALKTIDGSTRLYQVLFRHNRPRVPHRSYDDPVVNAALTSRLQHFESKADRLYSIDIYYAISQPVRRGSRAVSLVEKAKSAFSKDAQAELIEGELQQAVLRLRERVRLFVSQISDFLPARVLKADEAFLVLRRLVNPDPVRAEGPPLKYPVYVDYFAASSPIEAYRDHLRSGEQFIRTVTLKDPPSQTWPLVLKRLYELPANYHIVTEWHPLEADLARKIIDKARRHHHTQKTSFASAAMGGDTGGAGALVDESKGALVASLNKALTDMEMSGTYFGAYTLTIVLYDTSREALDRAVAEVYKAFSANDGAVFEETYNILNSFFAALPGGQAHNLRELLVTNNNAADLAFVFSLSHGAQTNAHLRVEYLALLETQHRTLYYFHLHHQDIGHSLVLGKTGSGKSFLLNFLATALQKYGGYTYFFDLGGSFKGITQLFGGTYLRIGVEEAGERDPLAPPPVRINPFSLAPTPENLEFLFAFLRVLIEGQDGFHLTVGDDRELVTMIRTVYQLDPETRRLLNFANLLPHHLSERLHRWIHGSPPGQYAFLFDNQEDTLELSRFFCCDFEGLNKYPTLVQPLLFYLLHRANSVIYDPALAKTVKAFFIDEGWMFLTHPAICSYIVEALKTWRKKNAFIVLSTQSVDELAKSAILEVLVESCSSKIFLANPSLNEDLYRDVLKLPPHTIDLIRALRPKGQFLVNTPAITKVLNLEVDPKSYWLYTNDPNDNARRDDAIRKYGFEGGLSYLEGVSR